MEKKSEGSGRTGARKPLRATVAEIDQDILRLLVRRANLLDKMRDKGKLPVADEKYLREAWQNDVARVSRDPELSGRFFALMQQISFLPKPSAADKQDIPGSQRRQAFNLAPPQSPVHLAMTAPLSFRETCAWLYLAAAAGQPLRLSPCLQNDPLVDFVQAIAQAGAAVTREEEAIVVRTASPLAAPDKVIHAGSSEFGLYLLIAHYLGRYSRVKLTGDSSLQLGDFSALRQFLPQLGARLVNIVPKSDGLPARLESSGVLPAGVEPGAEISPLFISALLLAAPFYEAPFAVSLGRQKERASILAHVVPILEASGMVFSVTGETVSIEPSAPVIPEKPVVAMDAELAAFLLGLAPALGGEVRLAGKWADWPENGRFWGLCLKNGLRVESGGLEAKFAAPIQSFAAQDFRPFSEWQSAFVAAMLARVALAGKEAMLPQALGEDENVADFFRAAGLEVDPGNRIVRGSAKAGLAWNAPSAAWAIALALAACGRTGKQGWPLGNPGIVMDLWPLFWSYYNSLPDPRPKKAPEQKPEPEKPRRRIMTNAVAVPPGIREEDWN